MSQNETAQLSAKARPWLNDWPLALLLASAVVAVYWPALRGGFLFDDDIYICRNATLRSLNGLKLIWLHPGATCQYCPLTFTGFWIGYHLWGLDTLGYHLTNVLMHVATSFLLWQVLRCLKVPGAFLAGAIFALHPVNVMSVAWMTELKNTLSAALALAASWSYLRFARLGVYDPTERKGNDPKPTEAEGGWPFYFLSFVLFLLALFAKTAVSFLPVSLLLVTWWRRKRPGASDVWRLLPMLGMALLLGGATSYVERHSGGASGAPFTMGFLERILVSGREFWFYLGKLFFPHRLTFIYPRWHIDAGAGWQYLYPAATVAVLAALWLMRKRIGKAPFAALLHFYVCTSLLILLLVLYMTRYSFVSDHWQYFGCMSVIAMAAAGIVMALDFVSNGRPILKPALCGTLLFGLGILSWRQSGMYADIETLRRTTIIRNPYSSIAHNNLGTLLQRKGQVDEALANFQMAVELQPDNVEARTCFGSALLEKGRENEAIVHYQKALEIQPNLCGGTLQSRSRSHTKGAGRRGNRSFPKGCADPTQLR